MNTTSNGSDEDLAYEEPPPPTEATVVIDPHIWKKSGLSRAELL
jgi:hypothetical protein